MPDDSSTYVRGSNSWPKRRRNVRKWRGRRDALLFEMRLVTAKLRLLDHVGSVALNRLSALAALEAELGRQYPASAERFQYTLDKIAQAMAREVDELAQRWGQR
jgi:hypothetical protein